MSKKTKTFTPKQMARLPDPGYVLEMNGPVVITVVCVKNGQVKYTRGDYTWSTLLWSCCPTRKQVANGQHGLTYQQFPTHEAMMAAHPELKPEGAREKAPNDTTP